MGVLVIKNSSMGFVFFGFYFEVCCGGSWNLFFVLIDVNFIIYVLVFLL